MLPLSPPLRFLASPLTLISRPGTFRLTLKWLRPSAADMVDMAGGVATADMVTTAAMADLAATAATVGGAATDAMAYMAFPT
ncbi:hypothetical protein LPJ60_006657, partial [Coemansia sp. RSA 2675]